jgi:hypothetical protein
MFLKLNVSFTVLVDILKKVDTGLVFTSPLGFLFGPNFVVFLGNELFESCLALHFESLLLFVELLKLKGLGSSTGLFVNFNLSNGIFTLEGNLEHVFISASFLVSGIVTQLTLSFVECDGILVTLSIECELLGVHLLFSSFLGDPLALEHVSLLSSQFSFFLILESSSVLLPVQNGHCIFDVSFLVSFLLEFAFHFLLSIKVPELSVHFFFLPCLFKLARFVNKLLFTLHLSSISVEFPIFLSELVSCSFKVFLKSSVDFCLSLCFTFLLQVGHSLEHLLANLFGSLESCLVFLLESSFF